MPRLLLSWIGQVDLNAPAASSRAELGPIARTAEARPFDELHLLCNYPAAQARAYVKWLQARTPAKVVLTVVRLGTPTDLTRKLARLLLVVRQGDFKKLKLIDVSAADVSTK